MIPRDRDKPTHLPATPPDVPALLEAYWEALAEPGVEAGGAKPVDLAEQPERVRRLAGVLDELKATVETLRSDTQDPSDRAAQPLGDYQIVREIARGGMGIVYEARQLSLNRRVALKILPFAAALDPRSLARFRQESLAAAQLDHPHIVPVYGMGVDRGVHYYAMRYIEGQSLAQVIAEMVKPASRERKLPDSAERVASPMHHDEIRDPQVKSDMDGTLGAATRVSLPLHGEAGANGSCADPRLEPTIDSVRSAAAREDRGGLSEAVVENGKSDETNPRSKIPAAKSPSTLAQRAPGISTDRNSNRPEYYRSIARLGIQAAEALDYAHAHGVLHRDVKPGNLLIDDAGNVWITDFGLARVESETNLTHTGDLMGTLRYTSPEQALGKRGLVDQRTDVYSLGATLYEVLTLKPVFAADGRAELLGQIANNDPQPLRRFDRSIPEELETIVLKCLDKDPADRFATAQDLADDLERYLQHKPIAARRSTAVECTVKWARRHKPAVGAAASVLLLAGLVSLGLVYDRSERRTKATALVNKALEEVALRTGEAQAKRDDLAAWATAVAVARRADAFAVAGLSSPVLRRHVADVLADLESEQAAAKVRQEEAARDRKVLGDFDTARLEGTTAIARNDVFDNDGVAAAYARAFQDYEIDIEQLTVVEAARRIQERAIRHDLVLAAIDWAFLTDAGKPLRTKLLDVACVAAGEFPPWERPLLNALREGDPDLLQEFASHLPPTEMSPVAIVLLARALLDLGREVPAIELLIENQPRFSGDFWLNELLGLRLAKLAASPAEHQQALPFLAAAAALRPNSVGAQLNLGMCISQAGNVDYAIAAYRRALELKPDLHQAHNNLGNAYLKNGNIDAAINEFRLAIESRPDYALAHRNLGNALKKKGDVEAAISELHQALKLEPDYVEARVDLATILEDQRDLEGAAAQLRQAVASHPDNPIAHNNLGNILSYQGDREGAITEYRMALELKPDFANAIINLNGSLREKGAYLESLEATKRFHALGKGNPQWRYPSGQWLNQAEQLVRLDAKLTEVLAGSDNAMSPADLTELAEFALSQKRLHLTAAAWYQRAFHEDPLLATNVVSGYRYNAACAAVLAATKAPHESLNDERRAAWRAQALTWLAADLQARNEQMNRELPKAVTEFQRTLAHWLKDPDLAGIRDPDRLKELPEAEREKFNALWRDVKTLLEKLAHPPRQATDATDVDPPKQ